MSGTDDAAPEAAATDAPPQDSTLAQFLSDHPEMMGAFFIATTYLSQAADVAFDGGCGGCSGP